MNQVEGAPPPHGRNIRRTLLVILAIGLVATAIVASYEAYGAGYGAGHSAGISCGYTQGKWDGQQVEQSVLLLQQDSEFTLSPGNNVEIPVMLLYNWEGEFPRYDANVSLSGSFGVSGTNGDHADLKAEVFLWGSNVSTGFVSSGNLTHGSTALSRIRGVPTLVIEADANNTGTANILFNEPVFLTLNPPITRQVMNESPTPTC
jgi:hypothetical protein